MHKQPIMLLLSICLAFYLPPGQEILAQQDQLPVREYTDPNELVSLSPETSFNTAIDILSNFSKQYANKIIVNRAEVSDAIGINIPTMHWRQALNYIVNAHDLVARSYPDYIEITAPPQEAASKGGSQGITIETREIEISATFFEGNRRVLREMGIDWSMVNEGVVSISNIAASNIEELFGIEIPSQAVGESGWEVSALFRALEASNQGKILASPTIKVMEGVQGRIQIGQDFSIKERDFAGNIMDRFYSTGTISEVTPRIVTVNDTQFIHLEIDAEKSSAQPDPVSTIINKQEAMTEVLLLNGEETVIGGLYSTEESSVRRGIPILKDLPPWFFGLRYLFGFETTDVAERELIIMMKATIVPSIRERVQSRRRNAHELMQQQRRKYPELQEFK